MNDEHQQSVHTSSTGSQQDSNRAPEIEVRAPGGGLYRILLRLSNGDELDVVADGVEDLVARLVVAIEASYRDSPPAASKPITSIDLIAAQDSTHFVSVNGIPVGKPVPTPLSLFLRDYLQDHLPEILRA